MYVPRISQNFTNLLNSFCTLLVPQRLQPYRTTNQNKCFGLSYPYKVLPLGRVSPIQIPICWAFVGGAWGRKTALIHSYPKFLYVLNIKNLIRLIPKLCQSQYPDLSGFCKRSFAHQTVRNFI